MQVQTSTAYNIATTRARVDASTDFDSIQYSNELNIMMRLLHEEAPFTIPRVGFRIIIPRTSNTSYYPVCTGHFRVDITAMPNIYSTPSMPYSPQ